MYKCPNCGAEVKEGAKFCQSCGTAIVQAPVEEKPVVAPVEEKPVAAPVEEQPVAAPAEEPVAPVEEQPVAAPVEEPVAVPAEELPAKPKKKLPILPIALGAVGVVVIALIIFLFTLGGSKKLPSYAMYVKDGNMFYNDLKKNSKSWQVTHKLFDSDDFSDSEMASAGSQLGYYTYLTDDGKHIFYIDKIEEDSLNLYYRELGNDKKEPVKVDADINGIFYVNEAATLVTYSKGDDGDLYQYNLKKDAKDKVASDVEDFMVSEDGKTIIYMNDEDSIYVKVAGKDAEKLASEVESVEYITEDMKTIYYVKEDSLYKQTIGKEKEKIVSELIDVLKIYESGEIYYTTGSTTEVPLLNYVTDDLKDSDAAMVEPKYPDSPEYPAYPSRPYSWNFDTTEEYNKAVEEYDAQYAAVVAERDRLREEYNKQVDEYYDATDAWYKKQNRDSLRESLKEEKIQERNYSLFYFDGKKETLVSDAIYYYGYSDGSYSYTNSSAASDAAVLCFEVTKKSEVKSVKMSEIDSIYTVKNMVDEAMSGSTEKSIAVKSTATTLQVEKSIQNLSMTDDGSEIYYIDNVEDEKNYGTLYRISISKGNVGKAEVYDTDVYYSYVSIRDDGEVTYFKEVTTVEGEGESYGFDKGELYVSKNRVDFDVRTSSVLYDEDNGMLYYTDYNQEKKCGTLKIFKGGKATKIADDVYSRTLLSDGRVLYLSDYSLKHYKGELNEWSKGKIRKIDDDVVALVPIINSRYMYW